MKQLFTATALLITLCMAAQPSKNPLDSVKVFDNSLWQYPHNQTPRFVTKLALLDNDNNLAIGVDNNFTGTSIRNLVNADGAYLFRSHNNVVNSNHTVILRSSNVGAFGADSYIKNADYSFTAGDYLRTYGCTSFNFGYANIGASNWGAAIGFQLEVGDSSNTDARSYEYAIGYNFKTDEAGVHLGAGDLTFSVLRNKIVRINGIKYFFTGTPYVGSVLTCTAINGDVYTISWQQPTTTQKQLIQQPITRTTYVLYEENGKLYYLK